MKLYVAGGIGENLANSFLIKLNKYSFLIDAGIEVKREEVFPKYRDEDISSIRYLFITHGHKDHTGSLKKLVEMGFNGTLIASEKVLSDIEDINLQKITLTVDGEMKVSLEDLTFYYGRSGHSMGSLWYFIESSEGSVFASGDFNRYSPLLELDEPEGFKGDIALIEAGLAYDFTPYEYNLKRCVDYIKDKIQYNRIFLPIQGDGRGMELIYLLSKNIKKVNYFLDDTMMKIMNSIKKNRFYFKDDVIEELSKVNIQRFDLKTLKKSKRACILASDSKMLKEETLRIYESMSGEETEVVITGGVNEDTLPYDLLNQGKAVKQSFLSHQNVKDALILVEKNTFKNTLLTHSMIKLDFKDKNTNILPMDVYDEIDIK